eukprot:1529329-Alexandrium_andersonii.AAC.1
MELGADGTRWLEPELRPQPMSNVGGASADYPEALPTSSAISGRLERMPTRCESPAGSQQARGTRAVSAVLLAPAEPTPEEPRTPRT